MTPDLYLTCLFDRAESHAHTTRAEIRSDRRTSQLVTLRHAMIHRMASTYPHLSYSQLGRLFWRHHTGIMHALQRTNELITQGDKEMLAALRLLTFETAPETDPTTALIHAALQLLQDPRNQITDAHRRALTTPLVQLTA